MVSPQITGRDGVIFLLHVKYETFGKGSGLQELTDHRGIQWQNSWKNAYIYLIQEYISIINAVGRAHVSHYLLHWPRDRVGGKVRWPAIHAARKWRVGTDIDTEWFGAYGSMPHGGVGCLRCGGGVRRVSWCRMRVMTYDKNKRFGSWNAFLEYCTTKKFLTKHTERT